MKFPHVSLTLVSLRTLVILGGILLSAEIILAESSSNSRTERQKVLRGQELVVSFPTASGGFSARSSARVTKLKDGAGTKLTKALAEGKVGVFSRTQSLGTQSAAPVEMDESEVLTMCASIRASNPGVEITCEANALVESTITPNDPNYSSLYGMSAISAPLAWDITTGSASAVVAIIDTGIDYTHPDLVGNIATNAAEIPNNSVDDDGNGYIDDYYGYDFINNDSNPIDDHYHGTHCAGTIGATGNNGRGVAGVAWRVSLLPVKVLDSYGSGTLASVAAGMNYAVQRGAKILSMSLGTSSYSTTLENAIINARNSGALVVAAAGNSALDTDLYPNYPSSSTQDNVISVAASTSSDSLAYFSNYGPTSVDLAAPGESILSTYLGGQYAYASGTSMSTPHIAGMAALLLAINPNLSYASIKSILLSTVDPIPSMSGKLVTGGRANIYNAVLQVAPGETPTPLPTSAPTTQPTSIPEPTVVPTNIPTPLPTNPSPLPTSPAMEPPTEPEPDPNTISIKTERTRTRVYVFGEVFDDADAPQIYLSVKITCGGRGVATKRTDSDGYYEFALRRPSRPVRCYVEDKTGGRSRRITVR